MLHHQGGPNQLHGDVARCIRCNVPVELVQDLQQDFVFVPVAGRGSSSAGGAPGGVSGGGPGGRQDHEMQDAMVAKIERIIALATGTESFEGGKIRGGSSGTSEDGAQELPRRAGDPEEEKRGSSSGGNADEDVVPGVCDLCVSKVINEARREISDLKDQRRAIEQSLRRLDEEQDAFGVTSGAREPAPGGSEAHEDHDAEADAHVDRLVQKLKKRERDLKNETQSLRDEEMKLLDEIAALDAEIAAVDEEEQKLWRGPLADYQVDLLEGEDERGKTQSLINYTKTQLDALKRASVLNDVFHITCDGPFGVINGLRLGRLPDVDVSWDEINSAWGHAVLLLDIMIKKLSLPVDALSYRLVPRGSFSGICKTSRASDHGDHPPHSGDGIGPSSHRDAPAHGTVFELYSCESGLSRFFPGRRFDTAMQCFLHCLQEVVEWLHERDRNVRLPFKIDQQGARIGGFKITLQFNELERWTKALKFLLIDLKWVVAFLESRAMVMAGEESPPSEERSTGEPGGQEQEAAGSSQQVVVSRQVVGRGGRDGGTGVAGAGDTT